MSAVAMPPKVQIINLIQQSAMTKEALAGFEVVLAAKIKEPTLAPRKPELKEQLDRIYGLYKTAIQSFRQNLQTTYDLGQKVIESIKATDDLQEISVIFTKFQAEITAVLETQARLSRDIERYETQIIPLLPEGTKFIQG